MGAEVLTVGTVREDISGLSATDVVLPVQVGESPLLRDDDLLLSWELV